MGLTDTPSSERLHIGFFGVRNAGKSSLVNKLTNQNMSLVSSEKGTTTDAVKKSMELFPLGPVVIIDTAGIDDEGTLGQMRVRLTEDVLKKCDIAVVVTENDEFNEVEKSLIEQIKNLSVPYLIVRNKSDLLTEKEKTDGLLYVSAETGEGIEELKNALSKLLKSEKKEIHLVSDFISKGDVVILVTPIDESAPKGRLILPQQLAIRDILDKGGIAVTVQPEELAKTLEICGDVKLVVTDSQAFGKVMQIVPQNIPLTSFSILMARYRGFSETAIEGAHKLDCLNDADKILIAEGCTHHRQCQDIGTVKLPGWIKSYCGKQIEFEFTSGHGFPEDLKEYSLIVHCGGCMLSDKEVGARRLQAERQGVLFTNYGIAIAKMNGILERSTEIFYTDDIETKLLQADKAATASDDRYSSQEVFDRARKRLDE